MIGPRTKLIDERKRRGMTQADVASEVGLESQAAVSQIEHGVRNPSYKVMEAWASLFAMSVDELFFDNHHHESRSSSSQTTSTA